MVRVGPDGGADELVAPEEEIVALSVGIASSPHTNILHQSKVADLGEEHGRGGEGEQVEACIYIVSICSITIMAAVKKSQSKRSESQLIGTRKIAGKNDRSTKQKFELIGDKKDRSYEVLSSKESDPGSVGEVRCFCNDKREAGEMVQCKVCTGWFHLKCLRMKEGIGVLDGRAFVCCFWLSVKVLELIKVVGELRGEVTKLRELVEVLSKENDDLVERVICAEGEWRKVERGGRSVEARKKSRGDKESVWGEGREGDGTGVVRVAQEIHLHCQ